MYTPIATILFLTQTHPVFILLVAMEVFLGRLTMEIVLMITAQIYQLRKFIEGGFPDPHQERLFRDTKIMGQT